MAVSAARSYGAAAPRRCSDTNSSRMRSASRGAPAAPFIRAARCAITKSTWRIRIWAATALARSRCSAAAAGRRSKNAASASAVCAQVVCGIVAQPRRDASSIASWA